MKIYIFTLFTILLFSFVGFGQTKTDLPVYSSLFDIKGFKKAYVTAPSTESRKLILKTLQKEKTFEVVDNPADAQFIIEYIELSRTGTFGQGAYEERGEMQIYYFKEKQKTIVWAETESYNQASGISLEKPNETVLTKKFLKVWQLKNTM